jgi:hypothetical protein
MKGVCLRCLCRQLFLKKYYRGWHGIVPKNRASFQRRKEGLLKTNNFPAGHSVVANQESPIQIFY